MAKFGGEMRFTIDGDPIVLRGTFNTMPSNLENEGINNQDGSVSIASAPRGFGAEVSFEDNDALDWNAIMRGGPYDFTVVEEHTNRIHMWTEAHFTGRPQVNRLNGEVTGLSILSRAYRSVAG